MKTALFLRGINVGGNRRVSMEQLTRLLEGHGYHGVRTVLQSGNVVVDQAEPAEVEKLLQREFGFEIRVMARTHAELQQIIKGNPFKQHENEPAKLGVAFLEKEPGPLEIDPFRYEPDEFVLVGAQMYLWFPNGMGRSRIGDSVFQKALAVSVTVRNWNTVTKMADLTA